MKQFDVVGNDNNTFFTPKQQSKKRKRTFRQPITKYVYDIDVRKDFFFKEMNSEKQVRLVGIQSSEFNRSTTKIQLQGGGRIPWGVDSKYGKPRLQFELDDKKEFESLRNIQRDTIALAQSKKQIWWPKNTSIKDSTIEDNITDIAREGALKKDKDGEIRVPEERWKPSISLSIPLSKNDSHSHIHICDTDGNTVPMVDLAGRRWDTIIFELPQLYFQGKSAWGYGPKKLSKLIVELDDELDAAREEVVTLPKHHNHSSTLTTNNTLSLIHI